MINILRRNLSFSKASRFILRRTQSTQSNPGPEKPFTFRSRPFLFAGGPIATSFLRLHFPFTNGQRTVGDMVDTVLRRAITTNWTPTPWIRWIKERSTGRKEGRQEDPEVIESALDQLEGLDGSRGGRRQKGLVAVEDDKHTSGWASRFGGWGGKQIERLKATRNHIPNQDELRRTAGEWTSRLGGWGGKQIEHLRTARDRIPGQDDLRRTAGEWNDKITVIVTSAIEPWQGAGTLKELTDKLAVYVVLKALIPVRLGAAWAFTPGAAKWVVAAWRRML